MHKLPQALPEAEVRPVRQIMEGEARVLGKTRATLYASAILIILTAALCVLATLIGWVFDRRRDFAIMKALGASERLLNGFFAAEAAALGAVGRGAGIRHGNRRRRLDRPCQFPCARSTPLCCFPWCSPEACVVALISAVLPIGLLRRVQPAIILRGE